MCFALRFSGCVGQAQVTGAASAWGNAHPLYNKAAEVALGRLCHNPCQSPVLGAQGRQAASGSLGAVRVPYLISAGSIRESHEISNNMSKWKAAPEVWADFWGLLVSTLSGFAMFLGFFLAFPAN